MSDFDKEAERERLREKYEREQEKRQSTERMSELLLKGATMTNAHCENCGDPIFRYDGEEFCPTCQQVVAESGEATGEQADVSDVDQSGDGDETADDGQVDPDAADAGPAESESPDDRTPDEVEIKQPTGRQVGDAVDANGADAQQPTAPETDATAPGTDATAPEETPPRSAPPSDPAGADRRSTSPQRTPSQSAPPAQPSAQSTAQSGGDADDALAAARESLTRTLLKQARRAENAEDPGQARDHLAAAREAAESLSALSSY